MTKKDLKLIENLEIKLKYQYNRMEHGYLNKIKYKREILQIYDDFIFLLKYMIKFHVISNKSYDDLYIKGYELYNYYRELITNDSKT